MLDPGAEVPLNRFPASDGIGHTIGKYNTMNFNARIRNTAKNYENYSRNMDSHGLGWQFRGGTNTEEDDSGVCSPPLWKTSPPHREQNNYKYLSPASKAQAIARGQRELMEMIRNMPESSYELSLKDLVEQQPRSTDMQHGNSTLIEEERSINFSSNHEVIVYRKEEREKEKRKRSEKKGQMARSGSLDKGGFLLKMVFPFSFGWKNNKKKSNLATKVSPKPQQVSEGSGKGVDKEWWKKRFSISGESESGGTSCNSGSTGSSGSSRSSSSGSSSNNNNNNNRSSGGSKIGCWSFFRTRKSKMEK